MSLENKCNNYQKTLKTRDESFSSFFPPYPRVLACCYDPLSRSLVFGLKKQKTTRWGFDPSNMFFSFESKVKVKVVCSLLCFFLPHIKVKEFDM